MKKTIESIPVEIIRKNIKSLRLSVLPPDGRIRISAPTKFPESEIDAFVISKKSWIEKQQKRIKDMAPIYDLGNKFLLFAKEYDLSITDSNSRSAEIILSKNTAELRCRPDTTEEKRKKIIDDYYKDILKQTIEIRLPFWEEKMGLHCNSFQIKKMKSRWGSCNVKTKNIVFNSMLAKYEPFCLDYIIVHELSHLKESNHSKNFWAIVERYIPNRKAIQNHLNGKQ